MNRHDSGFDGTFRLKDFEHNASPFISRSNTAPSRHRKSKRNSPDASNAQSSAAGTQRPASEKPSATTPQHKQSSTRRKSITSSSSNSTSNTRRLDHGSLPSSRRTSCTMVDPSRPARHYRIKSSQTCPTASRDVDDVLALHFRSCSLFSNPSYQSANPGLAISGYGPSADAEFGSRPVTALHASDDSIAIPPLPIESDGAAAPVVPDTTMHWMSPTTRKQQYEKIDRANSGFRGFFRKIVPKCVSGEPSQTFYENDKSDAGSIRRYRMDVSDEDDVEEKSTAALRMQRRKLERSCTQKTETKKKLWGCL